jgi:hypothetical protein
MRARCSAADGVGMGAGNRPHIHGSRSASSSDIARYLRLDRGLLDPEPTSSGEAIAFLTAPNSARVIAMTWKPFRGKRQFVRAFLPLLTCLMLVLTSFSGMAHAADLAGEASRASSSQSIPMATSIKCHRIGQECPASSQLLSRTRRRRACAHDDGIYPRPHSAQADNLRLCVARRPHRHGPFEAPQA